MGVRERHKQDQQRKRSLVHVPRFDSTFLDTLAPLCRDGAIDDPQLATLEIEDGLKHILEAQRRIQLIGNPLEKWRFENKIDRFCHENESFLTESVSSSGQSPHATIVSPGFCKTCLGHVPESGQPSSVVFRNSVRFPVKGFSDAGTPVLLAGDDLYLARKNMRTGILFLPDPPVSNQKIASGFIGPEIPEQRMELSFGPQELPLYHTVDTSRDGLDSFWEIADHYGIDFQQLKEMNKGKGATDFRHAFEKRSPAFWLDDGDKVQLRKENTVKLTKKERNPQKPQFGTIYVYDSKGAHVFSLKNDSPSDRKVNVRSLYYDEGIQWFEPNSPKYRELIRVNENITVNDGLRHFTWQDILNFSEVNRPSISFRSGGAGDWKKSDEGAAGFILVTVNEVPYWADAIGQIPFTVDTFRANLQDGKNELQAVNDTLQTGQDWATGTLFGSPDTSNSYDNLFILRAAVWSSGRYSIDSNGDIVINPDHSPELLADPLPEDIVNRYDFTTD